MSSSKSSQLQRKTLKKLELSLSNQDYYQSHQIIRTLVNRALTKKNYNEAIELLNTGIKELLGHSQWSSVTDLTLYLIKVFELKGNTVEEENIDILTNIIKSFPQGELTRQQIIEQVVSWTNQKALGTTSYIKFHTFLAELYDKEGNFQLSESSYIIIDSSNAQKFSKLIYTWALSTQPREFGYFLTRSICNLLELGQVDYAKQFLKNYIDLIKTNHSELIVKQESDKFLLTSDKLINLSQLVVLLLDKAPSTDLYKQLQSEFSKPLEQFQLNDSFEKLGELYFGVRVYRQPNLLQSLMSGLFNPGPLMGGSGNMNISGVSNSELD